MARKSRLLLGAILAIALLLSACGGGQSTEAGGQADQQAGADLFQKNCAVCHGKDARGMPSLGKDLVDSALVKSDSDQELLAFIKQGRPANDPENTTGVPMPAKGGNPGLTDDQILAIIQYLHTLAE